MATDSAPQSVDIAAPVVAYGSVVKIAHWLTFVLVAAEFVVGWCMPDVEWGTEPTGLIGVHVMLGSSLLIIVVLRIVWRVTHRAPPPPMSLTGWQRWSATITHVALYLLLVIMMLTGMASAAAREWPVRAFGFIPLPAIVHPDAKIGFQLGDLHGDTLCWVLLGVIGLHVAAALYHRFIKRDAVMSRMWPSK